jgi:hypothetical protein
LLAHLAAAICQPGFDFGYPLTIEQMTDSFSVNIRVARHSVPVHGARSKQPVRPFLAKNPSGRNLMLKTLLTAVAIAACIAAAPALAQTTSNTPAATESADQATTARAEYRGHGMRHRHHGHHWRHHRHHRRWYHHRHHHHHWYYMHHHHHHHRR